MGRQRKRTSTALALGYLTLFHESLAWQLPSSSSSLFGMNFCHSRPSSSSLRPFSVSNTPAAQSFSAIENIQSFVQGILKGKDTIYTREEILHRINQRHAEDCALSTHLYAAEQHPSNNPQTLTRPSIQYEDIRTTVANYHVASRSLQPLLNTSSIALLRQAAETQWQDESNNNNNGTARSSRFTFQRPGNYEAHVADLMRGSSNHKNNNDGVLQNIVNEMLLTEIYPMVRTHFWNDDPDAKLCVYDSLYIRYNATESAQQQQKLDESSVLPSRNEQQQHLSPAIGAGQPLHRDLGIVSVNIMLNDDRDFVGGGTFFENQLRDERRIIDKTNLEHGGIVDKFINGAAMGSCGVQPLKPLGPGYGLAHYSGERHAGAATQSGVRDIIVVFVTAQKEPPPALVQAALLKQSRDKCVVCDDDDDKHNDDTAKARVLHCRLLHQIMAVSANPADGEALQYLANTLIDYADYIVATERHEEKGNKSTQALKVARQALEEAASLIPCDARVYNTLGRTCTRLYHQTGDPELLSDVTEAYTRGINLLERSKHMVVQVNEELASMRLNYGLHLSNLDLFSEALKVLEPVARQYELSSEHHSFRSRIYRDAHRLRRLCASKIMERRPLG